MAQTTNVHGVDLNDWQRIRTWSDKPVPLVDTSISDLFEERVRMHPSRQAVCSWDGAISYGDLDRYAKLLANYLLSQDFPSETCIALCMEKSVWTVAAMLAIFQAGAVYVPIDPAEPAPRKNAILGDCNAPIVFCSPLTAKSLELPESTSSVVIEKSWLDGLRLLERKHRSTVDPASAAFVMYTSGTTSTPKGVVMEHRSFTTMAAALVQPFALGAHTRMLQFASYIWSPSMCEIFATFFAGGTVFIPSEEQRINNPARYIQEHNINTGILTPTFLRSLAEEDVPTLKTLSLGGEPISPELVDKWTADRTLIIAYGSTETNMALLRVVAAENQHILGSYAIGCRSWIVDAENQNRLAKIGEIGELLLQGWSLARHYLNNELQSSDKFVSWTTWQSQLDCPGPPRFCKTGDLARYNSDGSVQIIGRKDAAIKIRGQRVDPAEVECRMHHILNDSTELAVDATILAGSEAGCVLFAAICVHQPPRLDGPADSPVAIERLGPEFRASMQGVKSRLIKDLPRFMVPELFIPLNFLPRLRNGKMDRELLRSAVSELGIKAFASSPNPAPPRTNDEFLLRAAWSAVLGLPKETIGIEDNFYSVGGDSVQCTRIVSELRKQGRCLNAQHLLQSCNLEHAARQMSMLSPVSDRGEYTPETVLDRPMLAHIQRQISNAPGADGSQILDAYRCTSLQEGMFSLTAGVDDAYIVRFSIYLARDLDMSRYREAWDRVVARHPILRTVMVRTPEGSLMQAIVGRKITWSSHTDLDQYLVQDKAISMQCGDALARYCIVEALDGSRVMVWTAHHAIFDAWSSALLFEAIAREYEGLSAVPLVDFGDFVRYVDCQDPAASETFWTQYLDGAPLMSFPRILPAQRVKADKILSHTFDLNLRGRSPVTVATILKASLALLLSQYCASEDVTFGSTVHGRTSSMPDIENVMGPTIATIPVRARVRLENTVLQFLLQIQADSISSIPYEQLGLPYIRKLSDSASQACSFGVLLIVYGREDRYNSRMLSSQIKMDTWGGFTTYAMNIVCHNKPGKVKVQASFDSQILSGHCTYRFLRQLGHLAEGLAEAEAGQRIGDLDFCAVHDKELIRSFNADIPRSLSACMHDLLAPSLQENHAAVAVTTTAGDLTYRDLDVASDSLAHLLHQKYNIHPDSMVPICFEKHPWAAVAMLAVWKAGGAFVPLDPAHPQSWVNDVLKETAARVVVCSQTQLPRFEGIVPAVALDGHAFAGLLDNASHEGPPQTLVDPSHIAFVLYTSGTTGRPKGIVHEHQTWATGLLHRSKSVDQDAQTRMAQIASFGFDTAIDDIWTTLLFGGTVCMPSDEDLNSDLAGFMNDMKVTHAATTPSLAHLLGSPSRMPHLRTLYLAGEPMSQSAIDTWSSCVRLVNVYGPTEVACMSHATEPLSNRSSPSVVGRAHGCIGWVTLSQNHDKLAPFGAVGELLIEGPTLARAYLNNEIETNLKFIQNPAWLPVEEFGIRRLYKTGDLVRLVDDGSVALLGRADTQVKIRGQRVEISHVENIVRKCLPDASAVVVELAKVDGANRNGDLTAFVAFARQPPYAEDALSHARFELQARLCDLMDNLTKLLPRHMIPSAFIPVGELVRTTTGKTDRKHLRALAASMSRDSVLFPYSDGYTGRRVSPSTSMEIRLSRLWHFVLGVDLASISRNDSFLEHGGDSISAMRLVAAGRQPQYRIHLTGQDVLLKPRLADMALVARDWQPDGVQCLVPFALITKTVAANLSDLLETAAEICGVAKHSISNMYPCTPLQEGIMALSMMNEGSYVAQHVFQLPSDVDLTRFKDAWQTVARAAPILRTRIMQSPANMLQVVVDELIGWEAEEDLDSYLADGSMRQLALGTRLGRYCIVTAGRTQTFVWTLHHAVYDGRSFQLVLDAVASVYKGLALEPQPMFDVFVHHISQISLDSQRAFWTKMLATTEEYLFFPQQLPSYARPKSYKSHSFLLEIQSRTLPYATTRDIIWTAWALTSMAYTGTKDAVFGATLTGRTGTLARVENIMGPTFATVPVRVRVEAGDTVQRLLKRVHQQRIAMMPYEQTGLQHITKLDCSTQAACRFQTLLVIQADRSDAVPGDLFRSYNTVGTLHDFNVYALMVQIVLSETAITLDCSFDEAQISYVELERAVRQLEHYLHQLVRRPQHTEIGDICKVGPHDLEQLTAWHECGLSEPLSCIHDEIEHWALAQPDAEAISAWDGKLTYKGLLDMSRNLSLRLISLGVHAEVVVALAFEKSKFAIVSALAVLQAGGCFVFLGPSNSPLRLQSILRQSQAKILLVSESLTAALDKLLPIVVTVGDTTSTGSETHLPKAKVGPANKACIVFTSGSTGSPKGIILQHSTICASVLAHGSALDINSASRVLNFADFVFDMAIYELFTTLMRGGCVCVPSEHDRVNNLPMLFRQFEVNWAFFTPSTVQLLMPSDSPDLSVLVVGGEPMRQETIDTWASHVRLFQCSGPAETTLSMAQEMKWNTPRTHLGRPLGGRAWIVDPNDWTALVPIGAVGELVMEGPIVARGYIGNDAGGFRNECPWSDQSSTRKFVCGDLVRYAPDGTLKFVARKDEQQVKIRGQRVEVTEVEHHIKTQLPEDDVVVISVTLRSGSILAALVSPRSSTVSDELNIDDSRVDDVIDRWPGLSRHLSRFLAPYMVPSVVVPLSHMPLSRSGKINRRQLVGLGPSLVSRIIERTAPHTSSPPRPTTWMQCKLCSILARCLALEEKRIGMNDNFLQLGGDSILAMRVVALARGEGLLITVADLFRCHDFSDLSLTVRDRTARTSEHTLEPLSLLPQPMIQEARLQAAAQCGSSVDLVENIYPCTALQEGLLALSIKHRNSYMAQQVFRLKRGVDVRGFQRAVEETVVLQDAIKWETGHDLQQYLRSDAMLNVGLGKKLSRYAIIRIDGDERYFVWTLHHALYDGNSLPKMVQMIEEAYQEPGCLVKREAALSRYDRFIKYLVDADSGSAASFWAHQLQSAKSSVFPATTSRTYVPKPDSSLDRRFSFSRKEGSSVTLATVLISTWAILLSRYTDNEDIIFGLTLSGRTSTVPFIDEVLGPTIATIPFRTRMASATTSVESCTSAVQKTVIDAIPHQHYGLQHIRNIDDNSRSACNFNNLLVVQPSEIRGDSKIMEYQDMEWETTFRTYPLTIICEIGQDSVLIRAKYDACLLPQAQMRRMLAHFEHLALAVCRESAATMLSDVSMLTIQDEQQIGIWNNEAPLPVDNCIHKLIEWQAALRPSALAVHAWDGNFTYAELEAQACRVADLLVALGVKMEDTVLLCFEKSKWAQVALLGVLKAGAAFFLLDAQHPISRLQCAASKSNACLLLHSASTAATAAVVLQDRLLIGGASDESLPTCKGWRTVALRPSSAAYLIATSGTSGSPKISVIEHRSYCSSAAGHIRRIKLDQNSRVLQFSSYAFDTCIEDILSTLIVGGCICVPSEADRIGDLAGAITSLDVNWAHLTPSVANVLQPSNVPGLRVLALGGEALTPAHVEKWQHAVSLINVYGPSECCVTATIHDEVSSVTSASTIGRGSGCATWITDPNNHDRLAPIGTVGELLLEGPLIAREYRGDPAQTRASFIRIPSWISQFSWPSREQARVYVTGDLVRYDTTGSLVYIGRKDAQVKLRGQRLELGEIEHHIRRIIDATGFEVALDVAELRAGEVLVAYISFEVADQEVYLLSAHQCPEIWPPLKTKLETTLPLELPAFMIPRFFLPLSRRPLTWSQKLDRRRLRDIFSKLPIQDLQAGIANSDQSRNEKPSTPIERLLQRAWSEVLNWPIDKINLHTTFSSLGGDSISSMQVLAFCRKFGYHNIASVVDVFMMETIAQLSAGFRLVHVPDPDRITPLALQSECFDLSSSQEMHFLRYPAGNSDHQLVFMARLKESVVQSKLQNALTLLTEEHSMLRARFIRTEAQQWKQYISPGVDSSFEIQQLTCSEAIRDESFKSLRSRINVQEGPVFVVQSHNSSAGQTLAFAFHHLIFDLYSWRIFASDLQQLLSDVPQTQVFGHRSEEYSTWCQSSESKLRPSSGAPPLIEDVDDIFSYWGLPSGFTRSDAMITTMITTHNLSKAVRPERAILAALLRSFGQTFADRHNIIIHSSGHGRLSKNGMDLMRTIGWFTIFHPYQLKINPAACFEDAAHQVAKASELATLASSPATAPLEMAFNYTGRHQALETGPGMLHELSLPSDIYRSTTPSVRTAVFEIVAHASVDILNIHFTYDGSLKRQDAIKRWIRCFETDLDAVATATSI
ncbi:unnamed protein product [Zymoseptoria tritici ST99CH_1A5]|uniref:Carrier domain-containing protein n=1 Tax=Zymoseptoria tritici ST99CH_1A5 TaxID=1276529 RepID=A0A1Y6LBR1_ZYMTR|nr:unnamed protein product [Zymoseptoria tritici ST99CH_1A5]